LPYGQAIAVASLSPLVWAAVHGTWGTDPTFTVSASGSSVEGVFINGLGGKRLVEG